MSSVRPVEEKKRQKPGLEEGMEHAASRKHTNIVGVERVHADEHADSDGPEPPGRDRAQDGELALVDVVYQDGIKLPEAR